MHPILFKLGCLTIYSYGLVVSLAFIIASFLILKDSANYGISREDLWDLFLIILISGIIGARLFHVFLNFQHYKKDPLEILMLYKGGLAIHGAIITSIFAAVLFLLKKNLPLWKSGDLIMQYLPLGQAIGRIGCFLNGCCYGKPTASFLGVLFPGKTQARHPTQLYSSVAWFILFITLRYFSRRKKRFDGEIFLLYFLIYLPVRFFIDFFRGDLPALFFGLTASHLISIILFFAALSAYYLRRKNPKIWKSSA